nr:unnamed protein product [Digitaria exilis]
MVTDMMMGHGPSDKKLIDDYLLPKISGKRVAGGGFCIHDADVYSDHPYNLARKHEPAVVTAGGKIWYFFSPTRYVGGKKASRRRPGCSRQRSWTVVGADGKKKGTWNPRRTKHVVHGSAAGGCFRTLKYQEATPDGGIVRPGWMMVEYGVSDEHGGGEVVLCKVYKSPANGAGSSHAPSTSRSASASPAGKRKADAVERPDEALTTISQRRRKEMDVDDAMSFAQTLESELMCYFGIDKDSPGGQDQPTNAAVPPCPARPEEGAANDDDDVMEISVEEFLCSSAPSGQPEKADVMESSAGKLVVASSPELIDYYSDDEVLACPPMDDEYVERITSEPFEFLSDD